MTGRVVQKFGGTLLREAADRQRVVETIRERRASGHQVVVVVSAMGRAGDPYATDTLLRLAHQFAERPGARALDFLLTAGETISAALLAMELAEAGVAAEPYSGIDAGIVTTGEFGRAAIVRVEAAALERACEAGVVPVVTGFQGGTDDREVTTLGRGGSDLTAVALGGALNADAVEVVKDVNGVMSADPAIVPGARLVPAISYEDLAVLTSMGARVVQPEAVELAARHGVNLIVRRLGAAHGTRVAQTVPRTPVVTHLDDAVLVRLRGRPGEVDLDGATELLAAGVGHRLYVTCDAVSLTACLRKGARPRLESVAAQLPGAEMRTPCSVVTVAGLDDRQAGEILASGRERLRADGIAVLHAHCWAMGTAFVVEPARVHQALAHLDGLAGALQPAPPEAEDAEDGAA
ncbi:MAG: hypothetical protein E6J41_13360 [Chloroflexi bacterium]|nr:MAG: hypothetical protein E6J41_13360 [Chloroflexota bacterium]